MGTTGFSSSFSSTLSSVFSFNVHPILGAALAGLGFWPKTEHPLKTPTKSKTGAPTANAPDDLEQSAAHEKQAEEQKTCAVNSMQKSKATVHTTLQPLRVVRFVEAGVPAANASQMAGRMVISGRMADVCAELDRLAA